MEKLRALSGRGDRAAQENAARHKIDPTQVTTWKRQAVDGLTGVFSGKVRKTKGNEAGGRKRYFIATLEATIQEQEVGEKTADVRRWHGICTATFCKYKSKYGGMEPSDAKRLRALGGENGKPKRLLAEQMQDNAMVRNINSKKVVTPVAKRKAVVHLCDAHGVRRRRACDVLQVDRSTGRYLSRRGDDLTPMEFLQRRSMGKMAA